MHEPGTYFHQQLTEAGCAWPSGFAPVTSCCPPLHRMAPAQPLRSIAAVERQCLMIKCSVAFEIKPQHGWISWYGAASSLLHSIVCCQSRYHPRAETTLWNPTDGTVTHVGCRSDLRLLSFSWPPRPIYENTTDSKVAISKLESHLSLAPTFWHFSPCTNPLTIPVDRLMIHGKYKFCSTDETLFVGSY